MSLLYHEFEPEKLASVIYTLPCLQLTRRFGKRKQGRNFTLRNQKTSLLVGRMCSCIERVACSRVQACHAISISRNNYQKPHLFSHSMFSTHDVRGDAVCLESSWSRDLHQGGLTYCNDGAQQRSQRCQGEKPKITFNKLVVYVARAIACASPAVCASVLCIS